jgi:hypothetical protein
MTRNRWRTTIAAAAALLPLVAGCGGGHARSSEAGANAAASPPQLTSIKELRSVFNSASGEPILVVLIAPT